MPRQKKDGVNINYFIRRDVKDKLDAYCEDVGQTATMAIERILDDYLTKYMANKENASEDDNKSYTAK
ncbi:RepB family protein [Butyrivibrio sp. WCD3002]|uniref:RepB family protein n=1 Tax=Butyrivibrio sp. WCD3002 TaxID=1280676 RepID=UPI00041DC3D6|nr:RepB family protein [Butyrivibrio sp. WCD3002]